MCSISPVHDREHGLGVVEVSGRSLVPATAMTDGFHAHLRPGPGSILPSCLSPPPDHVGRVGAGGDEVKDAAGHEAAQAEVRRTPPRPAPQRERTQQRRRLCRRASRGDGPNPLGRGPRKTIERRMSRARHGEPQPKRQCARREEGDDRGDGHDPVGRRVRGHPDVVTRPARRAMYPSRKSLTPMSARRTVAGRCRRDADQQQKTGVPARRARTGGWGR